MPFKNEAHRRAMWANAPDVARRWEHKYGPPRTARYGKRIKVRKKAKG